MAALISELRVLDQAEGLNWHLYNADCVEVLASLPDACIDFSVYSPPFSSLYIYSESERDMGNVDGDEAFFEAYTHVVQEKLRATKPGRLSAVHVKDLVYYSNASVRGDRGLRDFSGETIRAHVEAGWSYHSRVTIWRCPVREMTKAKPDGLLFKNFRTDAARNRVGLPEYLLVFRKWGEGMEATPPITHNPAEFPLDVWQQWASPVWMDTRETDVLNARQAKDETAEKHLCPMPLDLSDRAIRLWSNPAETVLSPFAGIGSEGFAALRAGRKFVGCELKSSYYFQAAKNLRDVEQLTAGSLLDWRPAEAAAS